MTSSQPAPDAERGLILRAQKGEAEARDELARRHRESAYLLALQLTRSREDALDVAQDAMLRFFTHIGRFDSGRPVRPWLFTIVRNRVRDLWRHQATRRFVPIGPATDDSLALEIIDPTANPERDAAEAELKKEIWSVLERLSAAKREILILRDHHDLSYSEIATVLGIPVGTVMSRLHAARKALRETFIEQRGRDRV